MFLCLSTNKSEYYLLPEWGCPAGGEVTGLSTNKSEYYLLLAKSIPGKSLSMSQYE